MGSTGIWRNKWINSDLTAMSPNQSQLPHNRLQKFACSWGLAGITLILGLLFGSGAKHCDLALAVEVRRGTLWSGPAGTLRSSACSWGLVGYILCSAPPRAVFQSYFLVVGTYLPKINYKNFDTLPRPSRVHHVAAEIHLFSRTKATSIEPRLVHRERLSRESEGRTCGRGSVDGAHLGFAGPERRPEIAGAGGGLICCCRRRCCCS